MTSAPHTSLALALALLTLGITAADQRRHQSAYHSQPRVSFGEVSEGDSVTRSLKDDLSRITSIDENLGNLNERLNELIKAQVDRAKSQQPASQRGGGAECPTPFVSVMGECFSLSRTRLPWHHARHYCLGMGGDLATPSFLYALKTYILEREGDADVWVGGTDEGSEGHWSWINSNEDGTNTTIPPHHWAPDQPDNGEGDGEHCLILQKNIHPPLADSSCERYLSFVCQYHG
ncbi:perlucin-like isoform X2 [Penaeus japonicus]|uniref:perlucin-like isoform X2 n=1 Tax=Penaeus japonicus TaxID=27405 RepID=UPI001C70CD75|nr:perlucin-like isoform X2 [Penaeus japonicus]